MSSLEIVRKKDVRPMVLFRPGPRYFGAVPVSELVALVVLEAVRSRLERRSNVQIININQVLGLDLLDDDVGRDQGEPDELEDLHEFFLLLLIDARDFKLLLIIAVQAPKPSRPSKASKVELDLLQTIIEGISLEDFNHELLPQVEHAVTFQHLYGMLVNEFQAHLQNFVQIRHIRVIEEFEDLTDVLPVSVGGFLHEDLGGFPKLLLCPHDAVLVCRLDQGHQDVRVYRDCPLIHELQETLHYFWLNVRNGYFSFVAFKVGPEEHLLEDL
eukprot:CAMPEP_0170544464 /NCGR_PEP_ID=MMETSP0211-20121228/3217_1 /TAXON_ID=311385 /ORGANISM="Pseudokeronopsis sp., Strain OXSARD2" /LENGTH=270 /DNA_ID=CAMNT_0010848121 /DNA_START=500 /DNA_END=1312 /DNA_ORIENTATION=+